MQFEPKNDQEQADIVEAVLGGDGDWASCPHCGRACVKSDDTDHELNIKGSVYVTKCKIKRIQAMHW